MQRGGATLNMVLRIFLRVIEQTLQTNSPGAQNSNINDHQLQQLWSLLKIRSDSSPCFSRSLEN